MPHRQTLLMSAAAAEWRRVHLLSTEELHAEQRKDEDEEEEEEEQRDNGTHTAQ